MAVPPSVVSRAQPRAVQLVVWVEAEARQEAAPAAQLRWVLLLPQPIYQWQCLARTSAREGSGSSWKPPEPARRRAGRAAARGCRSKRSSIFFGADSFLRPRPDPEPCKLVLSKPIDSS